MLKLQKPTRYLLRIVEKILRKRKSYQALTNLRQTLISVQCPRCGENETIILNDDNKWECPLCNHKWKFCN